MHDFIFFMQLGADSKAKLPVQYMQTLRFTSQKEYGMDMYTLLYLKWVTFRDLLCSTWNCAQWLLAAWMGGKFERGWIRVYVGLSPFTVHGKLSQCC